MNECLIGFYDGYTLTSSVRRYIIFFLGIPDSESPKRTLGILINSDEVRITGYSKKQLIDYQLEPVKDSDVDEETIKKCFRFIFEKLENFI